MLGDVYQVLADCPHCRTEAAVVQIMDPTHPACHLGQPVETRCRLCGHSVLAAEEPFAPRLPLAAGRCPACQQPLSDGARAGDGPCDHCGYTPTLTEVRRPLDLRDPDLARRALARWAAEEQEPLDDFCASNMGMTVDEAVARLQAGAPLPTSFDVIAYLFPAGAGGGGATHTPEVVDREPLPAIPKDELPPATMDPRTPARVLISVMVADGALRAGERIFIEQFLLREGLDPLRHEDLRIWRPAELGQRPPPELAERLVEAAVHLSHLDRERDGSEWKVVTAFANAWGVSKEQLTAWDQRYDRAYATAMDRLWRALSKMVRVH